MGWNANFPWTNKIKYTFSKKFCASGLRCIDRFLGGTVKTTELACVLEGGELSCWNNAPWWGEGQRGEMGQTLDSPVVAQGSSPGGGLGSMRLVGLSSWAGAAEP